MELHTEAVDGPRRQEPVWAWAATSAVGWAGVLIAPAIGLYLLVSGIEILLGNRAATLFSLDWYPQDGSFGMLPLVAGTLSTSVLAVGLAAPLGLGAVIHVVFFAGDRTRRVAEAMLGILGGTPSVVFGLFGTVWLVPRLGANLASAGLVLAAMLLPTFGLLTLAALRQLPREMLAAGSTLGLARKQVVWHLALRAARPQIAAAATLALSRGLGEALAVEMVCGNVPGIPVSLSQPVRTLTTTLVQEFEYARGEHGQALHLVALAVVMLAAAASTLAIRFHSARSR